MSNLALSSLKELNRRWFPQLNIQLSTQDHGTTETVDYHLNRSYHLKYRTSDQINGGRHHINYNSPEAINQQIELAVEYACSGQDQELNARLANQLTLGNLCSEHTLSLKKHNYSCHIRCNSCGGRGAITCTSCSGNGFQPRQVLETYIFQYSRDSYGNQVPHYSTRYKTVYELCHVCSGNRWITCNTCRGAGENTLTRSLLIYVQPSNLESTYIRFTHVEEANDVVRSNDVLQMIDNVNWGSNKPKMDYQSATSSYQVQMDGKLTALRCTLEASSSYNNITQGKCLFLGSQLFDAGYLFDRHVTGFCQKHQNTLDSSKLLPLTTTPLFNADEAGWRQVKQLALVSSISQDSVHTMLNRIDKNLQSKKNSLPLFPLVLHTLIAALLIATPFVAAHYLHWPLPTEKIGLYPFVVSVLELVQATSEVYLQQFLGYPEELLIAFFAFLMLPTLVMIWLFGTNTPLSLGKLLRWYSLSFLLVGVVMIYMDPEHSVNSKTSMPLLDLGVVALLAGIAWCRKGVYRRLKKEAELYQSSIIMQYLGYRK